MGKGFNLDFGPIPYPDEKEAEKILCNAQADFLKKYKSRIADPKTGLSYADVVRDKPVFQTVEEKTTITEEELKRFKMANPHLYMKDGILCEQSPLCTVMEDETSKSVTLPHPHSLFN